ncbi:hypothetical protein [Desulforegula conservatrix]|uniref:hypothetical protein n=1 Tax=Desulforegula conservatrix TaxID=153026 RepID=UPI0003FAAE01|nr:hypothetical protein [Desulforegula conservatrix]
MKKCSSKEKLKVMKTPSIKEKDVCTMAASPEHARIDDPDLPCDDARGGGA